MEAVLELASEHGCPVDLHTDAADPARLARLAAMAGGLRSGRGTLGPCGGLGRLPSEVASRAADQLAAAGVSVVCLPQGGCGRGPARNGSGGCCGRPGYGSPRAAAPSATCRTRWAAATPGGRLPAGLTARSVP